MIINATVITPTHMTSSIIFLTSFSKKSGMASTISPPIKKTTPIIAIGRSHVPKDTREITIDSNIHIIVIRNNTSDTLPYVLYFALFCKNNR